MSPKIKICGVTTAEDAQLAIAAGASYVGVIFAQSSPRKVSVDAAKSIRAAIGSSAQMVGVFQNNELKDVLQHGEAIDLDFVQLHGGEPPEYCEAITRPVIKVFAPDFESQQIQPAEILPYLRSCRFIMFDRPKGLKDEAWLSKALESIASYEASLPQYFFAGGLNAQNLGAVLEEITPYCVDVASGVESIPGKKDPEAVKQFCAVAFQKTLGAFHK